jgi:hypothetical protein
MAAVNRNKEFAPWIREGIAQTFAYRPAVTPLLPDHAPTAEAQRARPYPAASSALTSQVFVQPITLIDADSLNSQ